MISQRFRQKELLFYNPETHSKRSFSSNGKHTYVLGVLNVNGCVKGKPFFGGSSKQSHWSLVRYDDLWASFSVETKLELLRWACFIIRAEYTWAPVLGFLYGVLGSTFLLGCSLFVNTPPLGTCCGLLFPLLPCESSAWGQQGLAQSSRGRGSVDLHPGLPVGRPEVWVLSGRTKGPGDHRPLTDSFLRELFTFRPGSGQLPRGSGPGTSVRAEGN